MLVTHEQEDMMKVQIKDIQAKHLSGAAKKLVSETHLLGND
jgi:hypothetical protein